MANASAAEVAAWAVEEKAARAVAVAASMPESFMATDIVKGGCRTRKRKDGEEKHERDSGFPFQVCKS